MSIPSYADLRRAVSDAAVDLNHPTKPDNITRTPDGMVSTPHRYGRVVYFEGGHVGICSNGRYLIAEGRDHQDSILALAHDIGYTNLDNGVVVTEVEAGHFWLRCAAGQ